MRWSSGSRIRPLSPSEIQQIRDAAYAKGHAAGVEQGRRSAGLAQPMGIFAGGLDSGLNGYSLQDIARHCARNKHRLNAKERGLSRVSPAAELQHSVIAQAEWLRDIFANDLRGGSNERTVHRGWPRCSTPATRRSVMARFPVFAMAKPESLRFIAGGFGPRSRDERNTAPGGRNLTP